MLRFFEDRYLGKGATGDFKHRIRKQAELKQRREMMEVPSGYNVNTTDRNI
jgi:hypothetical protein